MRLLMLMAGIGAISYVSGMALGAYLGIEWYRREHPPTITIQRTVPAPASAVMLIRCPVTLHELDEWRRTCKGRARSDAVKPKGE